MSIETEFESTITNVQNAYQGLDNLGATIPQNKTIENIKNCLDEIYNNLPKTSYAEGSNITLSNTLKGKLDFENGIVGYGDTKQNSYEGYNLLDVANASTTLEKATFTKLQTGYTVVTTNTVDSSHYGRLMIETSFIDSSKTYSFTCDLTCSDSYNSGELMLGWVGASKFSRPTPTANTKTHVFGTFSGITTTMFSIASYKANATIKVENFQIYEGSTDKTYEPYTNGASPNPSYPQEIEVVRGKNIFNKATVTQRSYIDAQGVLKGADGTYCASDYIEVYQGNIVWSATTGNGYSLSIYDSSKTFIRSVGRTSNSAMTIPINNGEKYIRFTLLTADLDITQIEKSSQATSYLPYNTLEVVERGKNEIPFPYYDSDVQDRNGVNWSVNENGTINASGTANSSSSIFYLTNGDRDIYLEAGTYKISRNLFDDPHGFSVQAIQIVNGNYGTVYFNNMVLTETTRLRIRVIAKPNATVNVQNAYLMIERGSTATSYEPYQTPQTYQLSLGEYEFAKIGNYVDTIEYDVDEDKVYKNKAINKKIIDGTEGWQDSSITSVAYSNIITDYATSNNIPYCTHFKGENNCNGAGGMQDYGDNSIAFMQVSGSITPRLYIKKIGMTTTQLRTLLAEIKPILYYALETEVKEEITGTLKDQIKALYNSQSFTDTTIIEIDGQLPLIIKVRGLKGN